MELAYLIQAHHQPVHLRRLVAALAAPHVTIFIHIDLKSDFAQFEPIAAENVVFLKNRIRVNHGGFSELLQMIILLNEAAQYKEFDYYIFLSGADYPIKGAAHLFDFLRKNDGTNFINFYPFQGDVAGIRHITKYYGVDFTARVWRPFAVLAKAILRILNRCAPDRTFAASQGGMVPYRGSAWCCLHRETARYVLDYLGTVRGKKVLDFFRYSWAPDEMLFHTIILNSPYAVRCRYYERDILRAAAPLKNENKAYLHYIDWNPERENPAILDETDFEKICASDFYFARKFDEKKSSALLDQIDARLLASDAPR